MSKPDPSPAKSVFQTPDPAELKKAAQEDPIQDRYPDDYAADRTEAMKEEVERVGSSDESDSQVVQANISGH